ncbi:methyltransferase [Planotetraspora thailandica]|uniref:Methyltransferase n=1 Tax=Planotetraspora thailandica TaxID=487172 RepID=A0A8J3V831_9ACTN|nr:methyltransferase domain-containing protein [Planotetraspora thailandica]GII57775.1 methyltransferase [Planotetraspora thailandica]
MDDNGMEAYFDGRAAGYGDLDWHVTYAERLVEFAGLTPGMRVLDAATGTGLAALAAGRVVGPSGHVVGADVSAGMLREAARLLDASGLSNVTFVKSDVTALDEFEADSFDAVLCCAGMLYLPADRALAAWHRILRPGGVVGFSAMREGHPFAARLFRECAADVGLTLADPMAEVGSEERARDTLTRTGFTFERAVQGVLALQPRSGRELWRSHAASPHYPQVASLGPAERDAFESSFVARFDDALGRPDLFDLPVIYVYARKP